MFYDNFCKFCDMTGISKAQACIQSGLSRTAYHKWKGGGMPGGEALTAMANVFGVSVDRLVGNWDKIKKPTAAESGDELQLTKEETEVIQALRAAPDELRRALARALGIEEDRL